MVEVTTVTISDCGKALDGIDSQLSVLKLQKIHIERQIKALLTQGMMIKQLVARL